MTKKRLIIFSGLVLGVVVGFVVSGQLALTRQPGLTPEQAGNVSELQNQAIAGEITTDELLAELRAIAREQSPADEAEANLLRSETPEAAPATTAAMPMDG